MKGKNRKTRTKMSIVINTILSLLVLEPSVNTTLQQIEMSDIKNEKEEVKLLFASIILTYKENPNKFRPQIRKFKQLCESTM